MTKKIATTTARHALALLATLWFVIGSSSPADAADINIASGRAGSTTAAIANAVCRLVNVERRTHGMRCRVTTADLDAVLHRGADMALIPVDQARTAGSALRTVLNLATPRGQWILVGRADLRDDVAYHTTKAVIDRLDVFQRLHPNLTGLDRDAATGPRPPAPPLHPASRRFLFERGYD